MELVVAVLVALAAILLALRIFGGSKTINRPPQFSTSWKPPIMEMFDNPLAYFQKSTAVGGVVSVKMGLSRRWIFVTDRSLFKPIFMASDESLSMHAAAPELFSHFFIKTPFVDSSYDHWWVSSKKMTTAGFWRPSQLEIFEQLASSTIEKLMETWDATYASTGARFDLFKEIAQLVALMNLRVVFGETAYETYGEEWKTLFPELDKLVIDQIVTVAPWLPFGKPKRYNQVKARADAIIADMYNTLLREIAENAADASSQPGCYAEFVHSFAGDVEPWLIKEHLLGTVFVAHVNTANILAWTTALLANHPQYVKRIRDEVANGFGAKGIEQDFAQSCARETTRLYPGLVSSIRMAMYDQQLAGTDYWVAKGDLVSVTAHVTHFDPELFPEPHRYNPERFDTAEATKALNNSLAYSAFGYGTHHCLGERLIMRMARQLLRAIFARYDVSIEPKELPKPVGISASNPFAGAPILARIKRVQ
eukprot:TRINITY_DN8975_c0_g1_i1.p1 TRINITY_DN8975_c0_g1~~TRINITY_DN8975_c0_g1_i1.p1  ORF type:complete len:503 (-),score=80.18 TRINITY_DN8975_c0_g1_i1:49-1485(-)